MVFLSIHCGVLSFLSTIQFTIVFDAACLKVSTIATSEQTHHVGILAWVSNVCDEIFTVHLQCLSMTDKTKVILATKNILILLGLSINDKAVILQTIFEPTINCNSPLVENCNSRIPSIDQPIDSVMNDWPCRACLDLQRLNCAFSVQTSYNVDILAQAARWMFFSAMI